MILPRAAHERKVLLATVLLAAVVLWVYYAYILTPLLQNVSRLGQELRTVRSQLREVEQAIVQEPQLRQQYQRLADETAKWRAALPAEDELPAVIERLSEVAGQTGVKIQLITPQRPLQGPSGSAGQPAGSQSPVLYKEIPIAIDALAGFHQLGTFLSRIESGEQPMQLRGLRISENSQALRRHLVKITLIAYVAPSTTKPSADRSPSGT